MSLVSLEAEKRGWAQWLTSVIPAIWEVEMRRIRLQFKVSQDKKLMSPSSQPISWVWRCVPVIPVVQEVCIGRLKSRQAQP
jgi:hypothetical protein